jgi:hypothetical protein
MEYMEANYGAAGGQDESHVEVVWKLTNYCMTKDCESFVKETF